MCLSFLPLVVYNVIIISWPTIQTTENISRTTKRLAAESFSGSKYLTDQSKYIFLKENSKFLQISCNQALLVIIGVFD